MASAEAAISEPFAPLLEPYRYKIFHGGHGSGKSWAFATALISRAAERPLRILCAREIM